MHVRLVHDGFMTRYLTEFIKKDLDKKIVLIAGPRQVGKTWLATRLFPERKFECLNYDRVADRTVIKREIWDRKKELVVLDEIHKMRDWKTWIKGIYDTEGVRPRLLLTGSARLDVTRRGTRESLAGRHFLYRLHPLSVRECAGTLTADEALDRLLRRGGFPEPFFAATDEDVARWRLSHLDRMLLEDLRDLTQVQDIKNLEYLVDRLAAQVGSPVSYQSLAEDVGVSAPTIKRWITALEMVYVVFTVQPWTRKVKGSLLKQPKVYFYDTARIPAEMASARFENLVACALLKHKDFIEDTKGVKGSLHYLRNKRGQEVDFLLVRDGAPHWMVECKWSASEDVHFKSFAGVKPRQKPLVLTRESTRELSFKDWDQRNAAQWLAGLEA